MTSTLPAESSAYYQSFFDYIDDVCPRWEPDRRNLPQMGFSSTLYTPDSEHSDHEKRWITWVGMRGLDPDAEVGRRRRAEWLKSAIPYVRAIDPSGYIAQLKVSTTRWPEGGAGKPADVTDVGYPALIRQRKLRQGWLIAEREEARERNMSEAEYGNFLYRETVARRRRRHEENVRLEEAFLSQVEREGLELQRKATEQQAAIVDAIRKSQEAITERLATAPTVQSAPGMVTIPAEQLAKLMERLDALEAKKR